MANRVSVVIDVVTDRATRGMQSFRKSVADADGTVGKFKAGASSAFGAIKANAAEFAIAGGAALVAFGAKAVSEFNDLAIEAGKLADALGMPVEEASKLIEVAGDVGIEVTALERTIGRMNREAAGAPEKFDAIGAAIARNRDGTVNVNETFLNTVDALNKMPDATQRAKAAQEIFGRSWMDIAELVGQGSDDIRRSLEEVSDQQIIDEAEVQRAREYRATMDRLNDSIRKITLTIGGSLTPVVTDATNALLDYKDAAAEVASLIPGPVKDGFGLLTDQIKRSFMPWRYVTDFMGENAEAADEVAEAHSNLNTEIVTYVDEATEAWKATKDATSGLWDFTEAATEAAGEIAGVESAWKGLTDELSNDRALLDIKDAFDDIERSGMEAYAAAADGADDAEQKTRDYERALIDQKLRIIEYAKEVLKLPPEKVTEINALLDQGKLREAEYILAVLARDREAHLRVRVSQEGRVTLPDSRYGSVRVMHDGGIVGGRSFAGLKPDEVPAVLQKGEAVLTKKQQGALAGGGINITVNAGFGTDGNDVGRKIVQALNAHYRNGGQPPVR